MNRRLRHCLLALCCAMLAGCSYLYDYHVADWSLRWYVGGYVQWDDVQEPLFRERVIEQLRWHQRTQLQRYRDWLVAARRDLAGPLTTAQLRAHTEQLEAFWSDVMLQLQPDITALLGALSDRQARDLIAQLREEQAERSEELADLSLAQLHKKRSRNLRKAIEDLAGHLDAEQRGRINAWSRALPDGRSQWLASRARWIDALEQALARRDQRAEFAAQMHSLFVTPRDHWDPAYRQQLEHNTEQMLQVLVDIHNTLSTKQRAKLDHNLEKWLGRIDELAADDY